MFMRPRSVQKSAGRQGLALRPLFMRVRTGGPADFCGRLQMGSRTRNAQESEIIENSESLDSL